MLTGRRAFDGEDVSSILQRLQAEPRWLAFWLRRARCCSRRTRETGCDIGDVWRLGDDAPRPLRRPCAAHAWDG